MNNYKYLDRDSHVNFVEELIKNKDLSRKQKIERLAPYLAKFNEPFTSEVDYWASKKMQHDLILKLFKEFSFSKGCTHVISDVYNHYYIHNTSSGKVYGLTEIMLNKGSNLSYWLNSAGKDVLGYEFEFHYGTGWNNSFESYNALGDLYCHFESMNMQFGKDRSYGSHIHFYDHLIQKRQLGIGFKNESAFDESSHDYLLYGMTMFNLLEMRPWRTTLDNYIKKNRRNPADEDTWYDVHFFGETVPTLKIFREAREHLLPSAAVNYFYKEMNRLYFEAVKRRLPEPNYDDLL